MRFFMTKIRFLILFLANFMHKSNAPGGNPDSFEPAFPVIFFAFPIVNCHHPFKIFTLN